VTKFPNGNVVFAPGTGIAADEIRRDEPAAEDEEVLKADSLSELVRAHGAADDLNTEERCLAGAPFTSNRRANRSKASLPLPAL
jgi:hypothetical protein